MRAWIVDHPAPIGHGPLRQVERDVPQPRAGELRVRVRVCGVCRTDLALAQGALPPRRAGVIPGHEVVGVVDALGEGTWRFRVGDRVGIPWLRHTCGACRFCLAGRENLCQEPRFTGWDEDGSLAEYAVVDQAYASALPDGFSDAEIAPLLCAGVVGLRALRRAKLPPYGRLGIYGFDASAHLITQLAMHEGATVHVFTRSEQARKLALSLGAASASDAGEGPPEPLDAAVLFGPEGGLVPVALEALDRGGTLALAGLHLSDIPPLSYRKDLFQERTLTSVTANTRTDGEEALAAAARLRLQVVVTPYPMARAEQALVDLAHGTVTGAAVLLAEGQP
ncbi:MAG TPA: zinc-dependent alcohol dehydrogenase family protein [Acidimicrobiales bacterium]|nr:zinc-dependent alcohol dehydrogenase family protein [Acidimicrobiales bacterium]